MYTISSFSSDTTLQSRLSISKSSSLRGLGTIKLLILVTVLPIMILTIINPMWICIFMKYPHVHRYVPTEAHQGANQVSHERPQTYTHNKGGIKITKETFDIIVASKDGRRVEELETTITVIENIPPGSKNKDQIVKHETNNKKETNNVKAHTQINKTLPTSKNNDESVLDNIREKIFRNRNSCAYLALSVILLCAVAICGIVCLSNDDQKAYESLNNDNDHYVRIEECDDDDDKTNVDLEDEKSNDIENKTNKTDVCNTECTQIQIVSFNDSHFEDNISTLSPPPYSSNTDNELISNSYASPENIQQSTDEN